MTWDEIINTVGALLLIVLIVVARIAWFDMLASFWLRFSGRPRGGQAKSVLEQLEERYARGEIDDDEFVTRRRRQLERP